MSQLFKDLPGGCHGVHFLWPEQFLYKFLREHGLNDILEDFLATLMPDVLRPETLVKDVNHLTAKVQDDER